jgi:hypothetical protein
VSIHLAAKHALEFQSTHAGFERAGLALDITRSGFIVLAFGQIEQLRRVADRGVGAIEFREFRRQARALTAQLLGAIRCAPDRRILQFAGYFLETFFLAVVLKETPSRRRHVPRDL